MVEIYIVIDLCINKNICIDESNWTKWISKHHQHWDNMWDIQKLLNDFWIQDLVNLNHLWSGEPQLIWNCKPAPNPDQFYPPQSRGKNANFTCLNFESKTLSKVPTINQIDSITVWSNLTSPRKVSCHWIFLADMLGSIFVPSHMKLRATPKSWVDG